MKIKLIIAGIVLASLFLNWTFFVQNKKLKDAKNVQIENVKNLLAENTHQTRLILSYKQAEAITSLKLDSLSKALKIKPRTIIKTVEKEVFVKDTSSKEIPVTPLPDSGHIKTWKISDQDKCWTWTGIANLKNDSLKVTRTSFDYHNKTTDIYYQERTKRFWLIKFGKKRTFLKSSSECGESYTREIEFQK